MEFMEPFILNMFYYVAGMVIGYLWCLLVTNKSNDKR